MGRMRTSHIAAAISVSLAFSAVVPAVATTSLPDGGDVAALHKLPNAPIAHGERLGAMKTVQPAGGGEISIMYTRGGASIPERIPLSMGGGIRFEKASPEGSPLSYRNLEFTAITPCRVYDSRPAYGGAGTWAALSTNTINIGPVANYTAQGGSATDCGLGALIGAGKIAAVMASVTTVTPAANGFLTFFSFGGTNPFPYGVSQFYSAGAVGTAFVVMPTDLNAAVKVSGYTTKQVDVVIDMVGYFAKPPGQIMAARVNTAGAGACLIGSGVGYTATSAACSGAGLASVAVGSLGGYSVRNLTATIAANAVASHTVFIMSVDHSVPNADIVTSCTIAIGTRTCTNSGTSVQIATGRSLAVEVDSGGTSVPVNFSYELVAP